MKLDPAESVTVTMPRHEWDYALTIESVCPDSPVGIAVTKALTPPPRYTYDSEPHVGGQDGRTGHLRSVNSLTWWVRDQGNYMASTNTEFRAGLIVTALNKLEANG